MKNNSKNTKMKKIYVILVAICIALGGLVCSCHNLRVGPTEEAVLIDQPLFVGHGGIQKEPVEAGLKWCWATTHWQKFSIAPTRYDETFDDLFSNDNTPLDFNTYIIIQIEKGKTPILLENYDTNWYKVNIQAFYRKRVRDYVSMYNPFDLISNREVLNHIDSCITDDLKNYVADISKTKEFPINIISVTTSAARPNKEQLAEMNRTAKLIQQKRSEEQKVEAEKARAESEKQRAIADKTYQREMGFTPSQFIELKYIEMIAEKKDANIDVLVGSGETPMWNIRRSK